MKAFVLILFVVVGLVFYFGSKGSQSDAPRSEQREAPAPAEPRSSPPTPSPAPAEPSPTTPAAVQPPSPAPAEAPKMSVEDARAALEAAKAKITDAHPGVLAARAKVAKLKADLDAARKGADTQAKLDASLAYNKERAALATLEEAAIRGNPDVVAADRALAAATWEAGQRRAREATEAAQEKRQAEARAQAMAAARRPMESIEVGKVGVLPTFRVVQVIDARNVIVNVPDERADVWIENFSTATMVDGQSYSISSPLKIKGTKQYKTVLGAARTVYLAERYGDE